MQWPKIFTGTAEVSETNLSIVTRLVDLLDFGQLFKAFGKN